MRTFFPLYLLISLGAFLGCTHEGNLQIQQPARYATLQPGLSTKQDVYQQFGQPTDVRYADGTAQWLYLSVSTTMGGATFVPIYGMFAGGNTLDTSHVIVHFSLGKFRRIEHTETSRYQNMWVALKEARQSTEPQRRHVAGEMAKIGIPFDADAWKQASIALKMQPVPGH